jgi:hypothetical protein
MRSITHPRPPKNHCARSQHLSGVTTLQQSPADEGAQDVTAQIRLYLRHGGLIDSTGRVKDDARRRGLGIGLTATPATATCLT